MLLNSVEHKEATEVMIISVDRDELTEITVENGTSCDQLNVIGRRVVVRVDPDDLDARLAISLHEAAARGKG